MLNYNSAVATAELQNNKNHIQNFRMWFKFGLKAQKLLAQGNGRKQHALEAQKLLAQSNGRKQHALKGQKLLAQGNALGCYGRKLVAL